MHLSKSTVAINGLVYGDLRWAVEFDKQRPVIGFDINAICVPAPRSGSDHARECSVSELAAATPYPILLHSACGAMRGPMPWLTFNN